VPLQSTVSVLNTHVALDQSAKLEGAKIDIPAPIIAFLEADVFFSANDGDIDPVVVAANAAVAADISDLEAIRILNC
jgi:hypothetical protein